MNILDRSLGELLPLVHQEAVLAFEEAFPLEGDGVLSGSQPSVYYHSDLRLCGLESVCDIMPHKDHHWESR